LFSSLIIVLAKSYFIQYFKSDAWFQIVSGIFNGFQFVIRCHHAFIGIDFLVFAFNVRNGFGEKAGAMVVNIREQSAVIEFIN